MLPNREWAAAVAVAGVCQVAQGEGVLAVGPRGTHHRVSDLGRVLQLSI